MNVLIAADMEGIAGIDAAGDCLPAHRAAYAHGRRLMTDEVLVAIDALRAGGVERLPDVDKILDMSLLKAANA